MKHFYAFLVLLLIGNFGFGQTTIHCWDFNGTASGGNFNSSPINVDNRVTGDGQITHNITDAENFGGNSGNACPGSASGAAFCPRPGSSLVNNGSNFTLEFSSLGYENIVLSFYAQKTSSGFDNNQVSYSTDGGMNFTDFGAPFNPSSNVRTFDFSSIPAINNNADLQIRITLDGGSGSTGNNRYDNIKLEGTLVSSGPDNPDAFSAATISSSQIDLIYDDNTTTDNIVIVFDTDNTFTTPSGAPAAIGNAFAGGTVIFNSNGSGTFNHTGLTENTTYYYMAYSYDGTDYSSGLNDNATTLCNAITVTNISPFQEGFEGGVVPPNCWASFRGTNGIGLNEDWEVTSTASSGSNAAFVSWENVTGSNAEDWLVSPALDLTSITNAELSFDTRDAGFGDDSDYSVRVSTLSQTDHASFSTVSSYTSFGNTYINQIVDLSAYDGQTIFIAFVMSQDNGDSWYIDDIEVKEGTSKDANIIESGFDESDNIDYTLFDDTTSGLDDSNAVKIGEFIIQDAGGAPADTDIFTTTLTDISFDITGFANIAAIALIDDTQLPVVNLAETSTVTATTTFSGLSIQAADDGSQTFSVYVTFDNTNITDNDQIQLTISAATADTNGSVFALANASGAETSIIGDDNRIEVTATDLIFDTNTSNVEVNAIMTPSPTVTAVDGLANTDLDPVTITLTPSVADIFDVTASFTEATVSGTATFNNLIFDTVGTGYTLTASSGSLNTDISSAFDVTDAVVLTTTIVAIEDFDSSTPNWVNDIASQTFVDPSSPNEGLFIQAASTNNTNFSGNTAFGRDLGGESGEPTLSPYTFTFDPVTITGLTSVSVSFDYHAFANAEIGEYEIFIDGVGQGTVEYFNDPDQSPGVNGTITESIPDGSNTVGLVLTGTLNGGSDVLELDNFMVTALSTIVPTCNTFAGNGLTGFGGPIGTGSLEVCAVSGTTIDFTYTRGSADFNDFMVIYIDSQSGGISNTANLTDTADDGRKALSGFDGVSRATLNFPPGFEPDFAISMNNGFAGLFEIVESGSHTFIQSALLSPTGTNTAATYTFNIDFANINTTASAESLKLLATYLNPTGAFRSNEAIGRMNTVGNPGANPVGMDTYYQSNSGLQGGIAPSTANGLWSDGASWTNGNAPLNGDEITINNDINQDTNYTAGSVEVTGTNTLTVNSGSTLAMIGGIDGTGNLNVDGKLIITEGGFTDITPTYGSGSTLEYRNIIATYNRFSEWTDGATLGAGVPDNVIIENATLDLTNGVQASFVDFTVGSDLSLLTSGSMTVDANESLSIGGNLSNSGGNLDLNSTSTQYSSLIVNGTSSGDVIYRRHINTFNSTTGSTTGQNDLISAPVTNSSQTFLAFRNANSNIPSGTIGGVPSFLFGPFDNDANTYVNYNASNDGDILTAGVGYRSASTDTSTFTFVGNVETMSVPNTIAVGALSQWNLIGNPYPSHITLASFLAENNAAFNPSSSGVYGYDGDASDGFTVWNLAFSTLNPNVVITPGQGFLVTSAVGGSTVNFTPAMRTTGSSDDFILGRGIAENAFITLEISKSNMMYTTDVYFLTENVSLGLDQGFDTSVFGNVAPNDFAIFSHLVEDNEGIDMAIQSVPSSSLSTVVVPLGVNVNIGEQFTISIKDSSIPNTVKVYLDDTLNNTTTILSETDYVLTAAVDIKDTGRYFLRFTEDALSTEENSFDNLNIYTSKATKEIVINGQLLEETECEIYDIQGRLVSTTKLNHTILENRIDVSTVSSGIYIVKLQNNIQDIALKLVIE
nr:choice-of-anchor J domain-containing protein [uncultured Psychroserpens sp.]